jgi:Cu(I)/Ag(I) efflux system membrane protein CusA/SilA
MVEKIIEFCARNRVAVLLGVGLALLGAFGAIKRIKLDAIPDLSDPQVIVFTEWMGRSPTLVEDQITYPLVTKLIGTPKVKDVRGYSMFGMSFIYVVFEEGTENDWARTRVLEYLSSLQGSLPDGVRPALGPDATGVGWVFQYALVDKTGKHSLDELRTLQDFTLRYAIGSVPGVAEVASVGGYQKQYQVTIDPNRMRAFGITLDEVIAAIRDSNSDVGGRILEMSGREYYVRGRGYIQNLGSIEKIVLRTSGSAGAPILIRDVAAVRFGPEIRRGLLEWNGEGEAVGGIVVMRNGENALQVIERVKRKVDELRGSLPAGVELHIGYDRSDIILKAIGTLRRALLEELIVVSLIIMIFLLHVRSSLLPILSLPIAVALAFIPMYLLDIPSTIMSLGGIAIAIGATVDAEIVMIEAAHKKLEHAPPGADRRRLLAEAAREVTPAIFFSLLIIAVAFLPVFSLTGQAGRLFRPLAMTKTFVMLISAVLSITFAPALRDLLIRGKIRPESQHPISRAIIRIYQPFVYVALRRPKSTIAIGVLALISALPLASRLGHEFMPPLNEGDLLYMPITFPNISIEEGKRQLQIQDRLIKSFPEVESVFGKIGRVESATDPAPLTMVETTVRLKPPEQWRKVPQERWHSGWAPAPIRSVLARIWPEERRITFDELVEELDTRVRLPGWTNAWTMPVKTRIDMQSTGVRTPVGIKIYGSDLQEIEKAGIALEGILAGIDGTRSVQYERSLGGLYVDIIPKPEMLARYGLRVGDIQRVIETAIGGTPIGTTIEGRNRFSISVRYPQDLRSDVDRLRNLLVPLPAAGRSGASPGTSPGTSPGMNGMGKSGALMPAPGFTPQAPRVMLAQNMTGMGDSNNAGGPGVPAPRPRLPEAPRSLSDAPSMDMGGGMPAVGGGMLPMPGANGMGGLPLDSRGWSDLPDGGVSGRAVVPLGQVADVRIVGGPPMVRDEAGSLVGYVYVDIDQKLRDLGGYVDEAKQVVAAAQATGDLRLPTGSFLKWTGQYEELREMRARMKIILPLTLALIMLLLYFQFRSVVEVLIVLLSIPFALVGSVWLLAALDYRLSTAVWVGIIALVGLAAQTGIVMILYIDHAYERRRRAGLIRNLDDIIWAHMEGTVLRVRPKLMTVTIMLAGLLPLLWADTTGADVMKRIAAPMVGGLITSAFLTLEIIPVIYTYWRFEQLLWEKLAPLEPERLADLQRLRAIIAGATVTAVTALLVHLAGEAWPMWLDRTLIVTAGVATVVLVGACAAYFVRRRPALAVTALA